MLLKQGRGCDARLHVGMLGVSDSVDIVIAAGHRTCYSALTDSAYSIHVTWLGGAVELYMVS